MADGDRKILQKSHKKAQLTEFSNYENAVTFVSSLEAWFEYRWGPNGKVSANLLSHFDRFPYEDGLTPDFVASFTTPYVLWGDHKRTFPSVSTGHTDAADQIIKYAEKCASLSAASSTEPIAEEVQGSTPKVPHDVVVIVKPENDRVAAEAIDQRRTQRVASAEGGDAPAVLDLAPIIVLGCYRDSETINGHWYNLNWRDHHRNCRFTTPNIARDSRVEDLNYLLVNSTHHAIPVSGAALGLTTRHPFINDRPPAIYTATRLIIPAICDLLTDDERDQLASEGKVEIRVTRIDVVASKIVKLIQPQPKGFVEWIDAALQFLVRDVRCGRVVDERDGTGPVVYSITVDNKFIRADASELFSLRASRTHAGRTQTRRKSRRHGDHPGQMGLFGSCG